MGRRAWLRVHLNRESPWSGRLRGGGLMLLGQSVAAAALALALLLSLARGIGPSTWIVLVLFVPLWAKSWGGLERYLARHASAEFLPLTTARILVRTWGVVLLLGFGTWGLWEHLPDLGETTLLEAVRHYASGHGVESPLLEHALTVIAVLDGARHWLAQHFSEGVPGRAVQFVAWMVVVVREWLFVWPWLLLCEAVTHVIYGHEYRHESGARGA